MLDIISIGGSTLHVGCLLNKNNGIMFIPDSREVFFSHCASFYSILFTKELRSGNLTDKWESCSCGSWWVLWFSYVRVVEGKCFSPSNEIIYDPLLNETTETPKRQNITKRPLG